MQEIVTEFRASILRDALAWLASEGLDIEQAARRLRLIDEAAE